MARPLITSSGRIQPIGNKKFGKGQAGGLVFSRIIGIRKPRAAPAATRKAPAPPSEIETFEERYEAFLSSGTSIGGSGKTSGTRPEFIVYDYLKNKKKMIEGIEFIFQSARGGGRTRFGGSVIDFELPFLRILIRVQGEHFHNTIDAKGADLMRKTALQSQGYKVVDVWAIPLAAATYRVMESALRGIEVGAR